MNLKKKEMIQITITGLAFLAFVIIMMRNMQNRPAVKIPPVKTASSMGQLVLKEPHQGMGLYFQLEEEASKMSYGRDPFSKVPLPEEILPPELYLKGIIQDDVGNMAIINDSVVGVGDVVAGNTIIAIEEKRVILDDGLNHFELRLESVSE